MDADQIPPELAIEGPEPFELEQLDRMLVQPDEAPMPDELAAVQRFEVHDDGAAEWCMAHVAAIDANLAELKDQRQAYLDRINRWHTSAVVRLGGRRGFFAAHLERYAAAFRARDPKRNKTLHLPSGVVKSSEAQPKAAVLQPETLVAWALANMTDEDVAAVVKMEPLVSELRKRTNIVVRPMGYVVTLECGHDHHVGPVNGVTQQPRTPDQLRADGMTCDQCDPDPIDGWQHRAVTAVGDWDERVVVMPVDTDDGPKMIDVAGATVDTGGVTFSVVTK